MYLRVLKYSLILAAVALVIQFIQHEVYQFDAKMLWLLTGMALLFIILGFWLGRGWYDETNVKHRKRIYFSRLSEREREVAELILKDLSNKEIITALNVEKSTLKTHINQIYKKCKIKTREEFKDLFQHQMV